MSSINERLNYKEYAETLQNASVLLVDASSLTLSLVKNGTLQFQAATSLGKAGMGCEENSGKTPLGLHKIHSKIGGTATEGAIFKSRKDTGSVWVHGSTETENMILSRILRLQGVEPGLNRGEAIDSFDRYIYIHGTNREDMLGKMSVSHGCILLSNKAIIELFELVEEGDYVLIY